MCAHTQAHTRALPPPALPSPRRSRLRLCLPDGSPRLSDPPPPPLPPRPQPQHRPRSGSVTRMMISTPRRYDCEAVGPVELLAGLPHWMRGAVPGYRQHNRRTRIRKHTRSNSKLCLLPPWAREITGGAPHSMRGSVLCYRLHKRPHTLTHTHPISKARI